jgi:hypothetical protein
VGSDAVLGEVVTLMMKKTAVFLFAALAMSVPAFAQIDLSGSWQYRQHEDWQDRAPGPDAVDFTGLPLNEDGKARALRYSTSSLSLPERECILYAPYYVVTGPFGIHMWSDTDMVTGQIVAWNISAMGDRAATKIWMDGRPEPPANALHTFGGFTTGRWQGMTLVARTTHFKNGWLRRNGAPTSDKATITMYITRHDDTLTIFGIIEDPVYLARPQVVSRNWVIAPTINVPIVPNPCVPEAELAGLQGEGTVPSYLPGENPFVNEMAGRYNIPFDAVMGGAEKQLPEYRKALKDKYVAPPMCVRYCCGWKSGSEPVAPTLTCLVSGTAVPASKGR